MNPESIALSRPRHAEMLFAAMKEWLHPLTCLLDAEGLACSRPRRSVLAGSPAALVDCSRGDDSYVLAIALGADHRTHAEDSSLTLNLAFLPKAVPDERASYACELLRLRCGDMPEEVLVTQLAHQLRKLAFLPFAKQVCLRLETAAAA